MVRTRRLQSLLRVDGFRASYKRLAIVAFGPLVTIGDEKRGVVAILLLVGGLAAQRNDH